MSCTAHIQDAVDPAGGETTHPKSFGVADIRHVSQNARCSHLVRGICAGEAHSANDPPRQECKSKIRGGRFQRTTRKLLLPRCRCHRGTSVVEGVRGCVNIRGSVGVPRGPRARGHALTAGRGVKSGSEVSRRPLFAFMFRTPGWGCLSRLCQCLWRAGLGLPFCYPASPNACCVC
jgi:hypothetical protein